MKDVQFSALGQVWLPVGSEDGDAVDCEITVDRTDGDELGVTLRPRYLNEPRSVDFWLSRDAAAGLIAALAAAIAEGKP